MGVVRPYRRREVQFLFKPKLTGTFNQTLTIENIFDASNNQNVVVKAQVLPVKNFFIQSLQIDFGICLVNEKSRKCQILICNTSTRRRALEINLDSTASQYVKRYPC